MSESDTLEISAEKFYEYAKQKEKEMIDSGFINPGKTKCCVCCKAATICNYCDTH